MAGALSILLLPVARAGERTTKLQGELRTLGFGPGPVDGYDGPMTREAIQRFQSSVGLPVTGHLDRRTREKLAEAHATIVSVMKEVAAPKAEKSPWDPPDVSELDGDDVWTDEMYSAAAVDVARVRIAAIQVLGGMRTTRARAALGILLYGNDIPKVRAAAAHELGKLGDGPSMYTLALALDSETEYSVRNAIAEELERSLAAKPLLMPDEPFVASTNLAKAPAPRATKPARNVWVDVTPAARVIWVDVTPVAAVSQTEDRAVGQMFVFTFLLVAYELEGNGRPLVWIQTKDAIKDGKPGEIALVSTRR